MVTSRAWGIYCLSDLWGREGKLTVSNTLSRPSGDLAEEQFMLLSGPPDLSYCLEVLEVWGWLLVTWRPVLRLHTGTRYLLSYLPLLLHTLFNEILTNLHQVRLDLRSQEQPQHHTVQGPSETLVRCWVLAWQTFIKKYRAGEKMRRIMEYFGKKGWENLFSLFLFLFFTMFQNIQILRKRNKKTGGWKVLNWTFRIGREIFLFLLFCSEPSRHWWQNTNQKFLEWTD